MTTHRTFLTTTVLDEGETGQEPTIIRRVGQQPRRRWWWGVAVAVLVVGSGQRSAAQDRDAGLLKLVPDTLVLSDATPSASFTLTNLTEHPMDVWLAPECPASSYSVLPADPIADAWHNQSSCAVPWLSDYPRHIVLAPHEPQTLSMRVIPPPTLPDGHYVARLIWALYTVTTTANEEIRSQYTTVPALIRNHLISHLQVDHDELTITYTKGPQTPRRPRTQWRATLPAKRTVATVSHTPDVLALDDSTRTGTFTLYNRGATPTEVWLAVDCPWFQVNFADYPISHQYESAWHGRIPTAALWLSGFPQHIVLAPHERRKVSIQTFPIIGPLIINRDGNYYARVVYVQSPILAVSSAGDTTYTTPWGAVNIVFHKEGAVPLRLVLSELHTTRQPDGTLQACVTAQQPGTGVVAVLHAEVDDAHGHPVRTHASAKRAGGGHPPAWGVDTTVAVWQVVHHNPMDQNADSELQTPDPICFALPTLAPGHYQLGVSVYELEDVAKHHPAQATLPLEVP